MSAPTPARMRTDRMLAAFHESGHVLGFLACGVPMGEAVIQPALLADSCSGYISFADGVGMVRTEHDVLISLAGAEAERVYRMLHDRGEPDEARWEVDLECARRACQVGHHQLTAERAKAYRLVTTRWAEVHEIALLLERRKKINSNQARRAVRRAS